MSSQDFDVETTPIFPRCVHNRYEGATEEFCKELSAVPARNQLCAQARCDCPWRQTPLSTDKKMLFPKPIGSARDRIIAGAQLLSGWRKGGQQLPRSRMKDFEPDCWNATERSVTEDQG